MSLEVAERKARTGALNAVLLQGADLGAIAEASARLIRAWGADAVRAFDLSEAGRGEDGTAWRTAARSLGLFARVEVVRLRNCPETVGIANAVAELVALEGRHPVIVEVAAPLKRAAPLRKPFEGRDGGVVLSFPAPDTLALARRITDAVQAAGAAIDPAAADLAAARLMPDSLAARMEGEKLALCVGPGGRVGLAEVDALTGDTGQAVLDGAVVAAADGDVARSMGAALRLRASDTYPVLLMRSLGQHLARLHRVRAAMAAGEDRETAIGGLRPPPFGLARTALAAQVRRWDGARLERALGVTTEAERQLKAGTGEGAILAEHALLEVCLLAQGGRR